MALRVNADFENADVHLESALLKIRCEIVNRSAETWLATDGWAVGYHLFDEPTGTLVVDGERTPLDLAPAQRRVFSLKLACPPSPANTTSTFPSCASMSHGFTNGAGPFY